VSAKFLMADLEGEPARIARPGESKGVLAGYGVVGVCEPLLSDIEMLLKAEEVSSEFFLCPSSSKMLFVPIGWIWLVEADDCG